MITFANLRDRFHEWVRKSEIEILRAEYDMASKGLSCTYAPSFDVPAMILPLSPAQSAARKKLLAEQLAKLGVDITEKDPAAAEDVSPDRALN